MNKEKFVEGIKASLRDHSSQGIIDCYANPPGRNPSKKLRRLSAWYHALSEEQKKGFEEIVKDVLDSAFFHFFCVFDGVGFIEKEANPWEYEIFAVKKNKRVFLNDPNSDEEMLHDLYQHLTYESE